MTHSALPSDKMIPRYFILFFLCIALVDGVMVALAVRSHSGTVIDHPYERGLKYNEVVNAAVAQEKLGWKGMIHYHNSVLEFTLLDQNNQPLAVDSAVAYFTRPTQQGLDFTLDLGKHKTPVSFPAKGVWEVRVEAISKEKRFQTSTRIMAE